MKACNYICLILVTIGGLNWGLDGLFEFDFIGWLFGYFSAVTRVVYVIIGVAALWLAVEWKGFPYPVKKSKVKRTRKVRTARKRKR